MVARPDSPRKVVVEPGDSKPVGKPVDPAATNHPFGFWDDGIRALVGRPGDYTVCGGTSADTTPHSTTVKVG